MPKRIYENADQQPVKFWREVVADLDKADYMDWEAYNQAIDYLRAAEAREKKQKEQVMENTKKNEEPALAEAVSQLKQTEVAIVQAPASNTGLSSYFAQYQRDAKLLLASSFLPESWRPGKGKTETQAIADVCIACRMATHYPNIDPLTILQNMYIVGGKPSWAASFVMSLIQASGIYERLIFDDVGDVANMANDPTAKLRLVGTRKDGSHDEGSWINWAMVSGEHWDSKQGSKWRTMPEQMARYRATTFFARAFCPAVLLGLHDADEQRDILAQESVKRPPIKGQAYSYKDGPSHEALETAAEAVRRM